MEWSMFDGQTKMSSSVFGGEEAVQRELVSVVRY